MIVDWLVGRRSATALLVAAISPTSMPTAVEAAFLSPAAPRTMRSRGSETAYRPLHRLETVGSTGGSDDGEGSKNEDPKDEVFFDDFGGFVAGGGGNNDAPPPSSSSSFWGGGGGWMDGLRSRVDDARRAERSREIRLARNWRSGNWRVRGFSLDKTDPVAEAAAAAGATSSSSSSLSPQGAGPRLRGSGSGGEGVIPTDASPPGVDDAEGGAVVGGGGNAEAATTKGGAPIHVSKVALQTGNDGVDEGIIAVGRTDGSVCLVQLGTEYLTRFTAVPRLTVEEGASPPSTPSSSSTEDEGKGETGLNVRVETELVRSDLLQERLREERQPSSSQDDADADPYDIYGADFGAGDGGSPAGHDEEEGAYNPTTPFEVLYQFQAADGGETIHALLFHGDVVYTAGGSSGEIRIWSVPSDREGSGEDEADRAPKKMIPVRNLSHAHFDRIVALRTLAAGVGGGDEYEDQEHNLLFSASRDGSIALWDVSTGDLVYRCQCTDESDEVKIACADVDTVGGDHVIYLGMSTGHVVGYLVNDLIQEASVGGECPVPSCRFLAHGAEGNGEGVTAIRCGGYGTMALADRSGGMLGGPKSNVLLTGGADGSVKQWEILLRKIPPSPDSMAPSLKLEHWPRLATQRMKRRAHLFSGHSGPITALACTDPSKFLSASADGTVRVWSPSKGGELFRMDGFTNEVSCLCLENEVLVTDGMKQFVCVHDFDVDESEADDGYELDW